MYAAPSGAAVVAARLVRFDAAGQVTTVTTIFHITKWQNLPSILQAGGLWCDTAVANAPNAPAGIGYADIKETRKNAPVPGCRGGVVADYVPFYFAPRSPMLYVNYRGGVASNKDGQRPIVHLVADAEAVAARPLPFIFTDGHAVVRYSKWFSDLAHLDQLDWEVLRSRQWTDTETDGDRKRRRQAELLVHNFFPWDLIKGIGVIDDTVAGSVEACLEQANPTHRPPVRVVKPSTDWPEGWYY
jgi:hypothetical protein